LCKRRILFLLLADQCSEVHSGTRPAQASAHEHPRHQRSSNQLTLHHSSTSTESHDNTSNSGTEADTDGTNLDTDVHSILMEIRSDVKYMKKKFDKLEKTVNELKRKIKK